MLFAACLIACGDSNLIDEALATGGQLNAASDQAGGVETGRDESLAMMSSSEEDSADESDPFGGGNSPGGEEDAEEQFEVDDATSEPLGQGELDSPVEDEAGGWDAPKAVSTPAREIHSLQPAEDIDCFSLQTEEQSTIEVTTIDSSGECLGNISVTFYEGGQPAPSAGMTTREDLGGTDCPSLRATRPAGAYVVCVEHADRLNPATVLEMNTTIELVPLEEQDLEGSLVQPTAVTLPLSVAHNIYPATDSDCFAFSTTSEQAITAETSDGDSGCPGDSRMFLYANGEVNRQNYLAFDDDSGTGSCPLLQSVQPAGDYVLCVEPFFQSVLRGLVTQINAQDVEVDRIGSRDAPEPVSLPIVVEHDLERVEDSDCFAFSTVQEQLIVAETSDVEGGCPGNTEILLFAGGELSVEGPIASNDDRIASSCSRLEVVQPPGDYVLCVENALPFGASSGTPILGIETSISVTQAPIDEAGELLDPRAVQLPTVEEHAIIGQADVDCFSFATTEERVIVGQTSGGAGGCAERTLARLYVGGETNADNAIATSSRAQSSLCVELQSLQPAGDYTLCVSHASVFSPRVIPDISTSITLALPPVDEAGDRSDPKSVVVPASELHDLNLAGDVDCFEFNLSEAQTVRAETTDGNGSCPGDTELFLYPSSPVNGVDLLESNDDSGIGLCSLIEISLPAGGYQLCVEHFSSVSPLAVLGVTTTIDVVSPN